MVRRRSKPSSPVQIRADGFRLTGIRAATALLAGRREELNCAVRHSRRDQCGDREKCKRGGTESVQRTDLLLGHDALDVLGLALDAVAPAAVSLDRKAADNRINTALLDDGAALRALKLVVDIVID